MEIQRPVAKKGTMCPLHKQDVSKVCHKCEWFTAVKGKHPQTEEIIDRWGCAVAWLPWLTVNTAQVVSQNVASTDKLREENLQIGKAIYEATRENCVTHTQVTGETARLINGGDK